MTDYCSLAILMHPNAKLFWFYSLIFSGYCALFDILLHMCILCPGRGNMGAFKLIYSASSRWLKWTVSWVGKRYVICPRGKIRFLRQQTLQVIKPYRGRGEVKCITFNLKKTTTVELLYRKIPTSTSSLISNYCFKVMIWCQCMENNHFFRCDWMGTLIKKNSDMPYTHPLYAHPQAVCSWGREGDKT